MKSFHNMKFKIQRKEEKLKEIQISMKILSELSVKCFTGSLVADANVKGETAVTEIVHPTNSEVFILCPLQT